MPQDRLAQALRQGSLPQPRRAATLRIDDFLPYRLHLVAGLASQALSQVYAERPGLGVAEWRVLVALSEHGEMTATMLATRTYMHKTKVSRAVAQMQRRGLLVRRSNSADLRESYLSLTPAGEAIYNDIAPSALDLEYRLAQAIDPADRAAFERSVDRLVERARGLIAERSRGEGATIEDTQEDT